MSTLTLDKPFAVDQAQTPSAASLAYNVYTLRSQRRMSVSELSRRSGLSRQILYRVEAGTANLRMDSLERLSRALEVNIRELLG